MTIEKFISPFIAQQFPQFYKTEGPNFIAFIKAYYEWMEQQGETINAARSLVDYGDIDLTTDRFLTYFKNEYIQSLPETIITDKRLLVKHILDLYRSKGSKRAYELLFRIVFNEDIDIFLPSEYLLKPSNAIWETPQYIECTDSPYLLSLSGKQVHSSSGNATAVCDSVIQKVVNNKTVNILFLSSVEGDFQYGDIVLSTDVLYSVSQAPRIIGSLSAIAIQDGGYGFNVGDQLAVTGTGSDAVAQVLGTRAENGKAQFTLINGGTGYSSNAVITVKTSLIIRLYPTNSNTFNSNTKINSITTTANGTCVFSNTTYVKLTDFSTVNFYAGDTLSDGSNTALILSVTGGGGAGASFKVGGLVNKQVLSIANDVISGYGSTALNALAYGFPKSPSANISSTILSALTINNIEAGTISYLTSINPGSGYSSPPYVDLYDPYVAPLGIPSPSGISGHDALVTTAVSNANGIITAVGVVDSGLSYTPSETVTLSAANSSIVATGTAIISTQGTLTPFWRTDSGFVSDPTGTIQDSYYYQQSSYEIVAARMLSSYKALVTDLIHPAGLALFGRFSLQREFESQANSTSISIQSS